MKIPITFLFFILLSICSCTKDKDLHISITGTVLEYGSNKPIADATIFLERADKDAFLAQAYSTYQTTTSDANGKYAFTFNYESAYKYEVIATDNIHFQSEYYTVKQGENNINIIQYAPGYLKLHVKNITPFNQTDEFYVNGSDASSGGIHIYGNAIDTFLIFKNCGGRDNSLIWAVIKNNTTNNYNHSIFYPAFDTTNFSINY